jgi:hypothetical protein
MWLCNLRLESWLGVPFGGSKCRRQGLARLTRLRQISGLCLGHATKCINTPQDVFNTAELPVDIAAIGQSLLVRQWHKTRILAHFGELKRSASLPNRLPLCTLLM